jgi:glucose-6-phosphate 1-epimerase
MSWKTGGMCSSPDDATRGGPGSPDRAAADLLSTEDFTSLPQAPLAASESGRITRAHMGSVDLLVLEFRGATAVISEFGAQVLTYRPADAAREVLFTSSRAVFDATTAIRGGVPVCWPWFGPAAQPQHGWARISRWSLETATVTETAAIVTLSLDHHNGRADVTVCLDDGLEVELRHAATPELDIAPTAALHAYFRVGDAARTTVTGITAEPRDFPPEGIDRAYSLGEFPSERTLRIEDPVLARTIRLSTNATDAVVWNPARRLADTTAEAHRGFVCVEPARISRPLAASDALRMRLMATAQPPGEAVSIKQLRKC